MRFIGPDLITVSHSKIISAINLKLNGLEQLQHPVVTARNLIPWTMDTQPNFTSATILTFK